MLKARYYTEPTDIDQLVFEKLVAPNHYLRQVKQLIDFERLRVQVQDCYSPAMGRGAEDPVRLIKLEFLQFHYNLSDREVVAQAQVNVAFRYFLDLALESALPVPSLLSQFRTRLGVTRHQALFDQIVTQAREYGLIRDRLRLKDATHVLANIAVPSTLRLVAQTRQRLLAAARPYTPERVAAEEAEAEAVRQATADLPDTDRLVARVTQLRTIVAWADEVEQTLGPVAAQDTPRRRFADALRLAHRVLADREQPERGDKVRSSVDADARCGKHGGYFDGYLLDISLDADSELLTALNLLPGNGDEARDTPVLLEAEARAQGNEVAAVSLDGIGWNGEVLHTLSDPQGLGVDVYVPPPPKPEPGALFGPEAFVLDEAGEALTCPGGEQTTTKARNANNTGWKFRFARRQCAACPLQARCLAKLPQTKGRSVIKNEYQAEYAAARARATTPAYTAVRQVHPRVERKLADIVRYHGGRHCRYRGRWRGQIQYLLTGLVVNIKRMVKLLCPSGGQLVLQPG